VEALKYYPLFFGKYEKEKKSTSDNYTRILKDIERVLGMEDAEVDVNSLFIGK